MFGYSWGPLLIILVIVLLLFGPKRLPDLAESIGKAIRSFKKAHEDPESLTAKPDSEKTGASPGGKSCPACHKELSGDFAFCPHCGKDLKSA